MQLETERLILRDWELKDVDDLVDGLNNIEVARWLAFVPSPYTRADAEKWVSFCMKNSAGDGDRSFYHFAIELKADKKVIGGLSLDKINHASGTAGGGIWLNCRYHGHGYGTEAFRRRIGFAFNELKLRRLENGYFKDNEASFKMQTKLGYTFEGIRKQAFLCMATGEIMDEYVMGLEVIG